MVRNIRYNFYTKSISMGKSVLVHICCSVDSHFFLQKLQKLYPDEKLVGFFYDPNIHPYSEYRLRLLDVKRSCEKLGVELIEGDYDYEGWLKAVSGLENEPEKGRRCSICFDNRLEESARKALEIGEKSLTTTLLTSPKKSIEQLRQRANKISEKYNIDIITPDFRKGGGTSEQFAMAKRDMLYHQNYCGCMYALSMQRESQNRFKDELCLPVTKQILPSSIEERIELYERVYELEKENIHFRLRREKFLNYRLLKAYVKKEKVVIPSYIIFYSYLKRGYTRGKLDFIKDGIGYFSREEILFLDIERLNRLMGKDYGSVRDMLKKPPEIEEEILLRNMVCDTPVLSLSPIIVLDELTSNRYEIGLNSKIYDDVRENLVIFR